MVDLVAYGGYKFVGLVSFSASFRARDEMVMLTFRYRVIFALIAGFVLSGPLWTLIFVYTFLANAFFLVSCFFFPFLVGINRLIAILTSNSSGLSALSSFPTPLTYQLRMPPRL